MARWKLACPHYINTPGIEWEYNETRNGKVNRAHALPSSLLHRGPRRLDQQMGLKDDEDGETAVCLEGKGAQGDIVFIGDPTPAILLPSMTKLVPCRRPLRPAGPTSQRRRC